MGQGAIDYIGVKGGLKLNDVIEEFKYVYKGQEIKAGDFVNYINGVASGSIGTDIAEYEQQVTPATEPPFDGIALSNGVGGTDTGHNEQVKIAKPNI